MDKEGENKREREMGAGRLAGTACHRGDQKFPWKASELKNEPRGIQQNHTKSEKAGFNHASRAAGEGSEKSRRGEKNGQGRHLSDKMTT